MDYMEWDDDMENVDNSDWDEEDRQSQGGGTGLAISGDNYEFSIKLEQDEQGNNHITTVQKFDQYFMYGIDKLGGSTEDMHPCGPGTN